MNKAEIKKLNKQTEVEYYYGFGIEEMRANLKQLLRDTRQEPGIPIRELAEILKGVFAPSEIISLKKEI